MGHYARVIRGGKVLDTDTDKILLEDGNCILYEENGHVLNVEVIDKNNNILRAHYPNDFFVGDNLMLDDDDKILLEDDSGDFLIQEDFSYWIKTSYNTMRGVHYINANDKVDNKDVLTPSGIQYKARRKNYVGSGIGIYSGDKDMFHNPRPRSKRNFDEYVSFESWTMDDNGVWTSPLGDAPLLPEDPNADNSSVPRYHWFENLYRTDNTKGWVLINPDD
tara:strand:+ start:186 stop:845 length:660 start_codon:yes stop_codon:yes gene_type:complete